MNDIKVHYYKKIYVDDSNISGKGLFAGENINKGEPILSFGGIFALQKERYSGKYLSSTFVGVSETIILCESIDSEKDLSDYINHSCNPNVGMLDCLTIMAIRNINKNEEIVCDYSFWEADEKWKLETICNCGYKNCRKKISGLDWKNIKITDKNFEFYSPFLKRRIINNAE